MAPGFADVLAYFRFDDLLASLMVNNWPRAPRREGERSACGTQRLLGGGKASRLCPGSSDVDLFGYGESVVDLNAEVAHRALDLLGPQQKLYCPQIARAAVDECCLCSAQ